MNSNGKVTKKVTSSRKVRDTVWELAKNERVRAAAVLVVEAVVQLGRAVTDALKEGKAVKEATAAEWEIAEAI